MQYITSNNKNNPLKNKEFLCVGGGYCFALTDKQKFLTINTNRKVPFGVFYYQNERKIKWN